MMGDAMSRATQCHVPWPDLEKVGDAPPPDNPPLRVGDWAMLNSGSPMLLVVDDDDETVTVALTGDNGINTPERTSVRRAR
jgi:hypothetical protein